MIHKVALFFAGVVMDLLGFFELTSPWFNQVAPPWEWGILFLSIGVILNLVGYFL